ncbi:hypothetical protein OESDEN_02752, partial [Oesophagostomum dentatum]
MLLRVFTAILALLKTIAQICCYQFGLWNDLKWKWVSSSASVV